MHDVHLFLEALTLVLCTAGVTTVVFQWIKQPVVLGYILAGLIVGPYVPIPLAADPDIVRTLSELGVILLMFSLGLEFSFGKLIQVGPTAGLTAVIQTSVMVWLGYLVGQAFGWSSLESLFTGAIIAVSSTTIIAKAFDEQGIRGRLRELVVGILIVEDLIGILLMAILTAVASGAGLSAGTLLVSTGKLAAFLVGLVAIGLLVVPRTIRAIDRLHRPETTLVASIGICFATALLAMEFGYSVALGAFIGGSLVSESGKGREIEHLVQPVRDMFAAIFFVSVGMLIDPHVIVEHWLAVLVLTVVVIAGKIGGVSIAAFLTGNGTRTSVQAGMSLAQIGEFSFIIASLGIALGAIEGFLYPIAVAVSAITTLTTPWLIRGSGGAAVFIDRKMPKGLQTFAALYASWIERLRAAPAEGTRRTRTRRLVGLLVVDTGLLAAVLIGASLGYASAVAALAPFVGGPGPARLGVVVGALLLGAPFAAGILQLSRALAATLAEVAMPVSAGADPSAVPRRVLARTLQVVVVLLATMPLLAVTQPFLPRVPATLAVPALLGALALVLWRGTNRLQGHVRAGVEVIVETLASQTRPGTAAEAPPDALAAFGQPVPLRLTDASPAIGKTLAELDLRGLTGATVLAITREGHGVRIPDAKERLVVGDVLALAGTQDAVAAAKGLLT